MGFSSAPSSPPCRVGWGWASLGVCLFSALGVGGVSLCPQNGESLNSWKEARTQLGVALP